MISNHQFQVSGMSCGHCASAIQNALQALDPQARVQIELARSRVEVDSAQPREALAAAIASAGYTPQ